MGYFYNLVKRIRYSYAKLSSYFLGKFEPGDFVNLVIMYERRISMSQEVDAVWSEQ